jgi:hypothetical protein
MRENVWLNQEEWALRYSISGGNKKIIWSEEEYILDFVTCILVEVHGHFEGCADFILRIGG